MLILKGKKGKLPICCRIVSDIDNFKVREDCVLISYNANMRILEGAYEFHNCDSVDSFLKEIKKIKEKFFDKGIVLIYTNEKESDIQLIKEYLESLENDNKILYGIVSCKGD